MTTIISKVMIRISDPFDLGEFLGWKGLEAHVKARNNSALLLRLSLPFEFRGVVCEYVVASPRHAGVTLDPLGRGESINCAHTRITSQAATSTEPLDLSRWRGGLAFLGTVDPIG